MIMRSTVLTVVLSVCVILFALPPIAEAQIEIIPGSSERGERLFKSMDCISCHSFNGAGGTLAPDLSQKREIVRTPIQLATVLWNHAPRMWRAQEAGHIRRAPDSTQTADLFAYFYSLAYFSLPGNKARGATVFDKKGCASCHDVAPSAPQKTKRHAGPPVSAWAGTGDLLSWSEKMWNHAGQTLDEFSSTGFAWPQFSSQEMADMLAYLQSLPHARLQAAVFQPGNPELGGITFDRYCESCHSFGGGTHQTKIDLLSRPRPSSLSGYVTMMWNHAPQMRLRAGSQFPVLAPGDMSNLVAYLFAKRYFDEQGNAQRGARVFQTKGCASCHEERRQQTGAPELTQATERYSPITISAAVWRHGPAMRDRISKEGLSWPELKPSEMLDLITYLNSRLVPRIAN